MKLPTDQKIRNQLLILLGVASVIILVLGYFGLSSLLTRRAESKIKLDAALDQLFKIQTEIKALPALRQSRDNLFGAIQLASTNYILFHEYRNYHLTAREILLPLAAEMNLIIDIPKEGSVIDFPIAEVKTTNKTAKATSSSRSAAKGYPGPASSTFALYPVTVTGKAGFIQLLGFLRRIESINPYLAVSELSVQGDPAVPDRHDFILTLHWPIWKNLELKPKREDLILPTQAYANEPETK